MPAPNIFQPIIWQGSRGRTPGTAPPGNIAPTPPPESSPGSRTETRAQAAPPGLGEQAPPPHSCSCQRATCRGTAAGAPARRALRQPRRHARIQQRQEAQERQRDRRGQHAARIRERAAAPPPPAEAPVRAALARVGSLPHVPAPEGGGCSELTCILIPTQISTNDQNLQTVWDPLLL